MSTKVRKHMGSKLAPEHIRPAMENFAKQGRTVREFCEAYGISDATYYNWRKKYCTAPDIPTPGFIEIIPATSTLIQNQEKLFAQVREIL
ncbi:IS66 family insertion sequence element accessory protein TnpA [Chitinophaga tropicalis]|uniref:Transposase n=1 Tax=Chitinophaga tropicalis TaxID=2683588 RepID=A0A7K1U5M8_9BACT|nr:transposase [Chitinophaga tropicalis]MVT09671.1 transposase [Chitinophaga tropicalis]